MKLQAFLNGKVTLMAGDCLDAVKTLPDNSIDSVVTDPPYALVSITKRFGKSGSAPVKVPEGGTGAYARASAGFMGKTWDTGERAFAIEFWAEVWRVLKPGGHVAAFSGTRTYHRLAVAIEDAGFEIRDSIYWHYGSGFPKSHDVKKAVNRHLLAASGDWDALGPTPDTPQGERWRGWGTALKPATEPICLARKPLIGTVAANVLEHGTGAINVDGCRVGTEQTITVRNGDSGGNGAFGRDERKGEWQNPPGRFPANLVHDGSEEVLAGFPDTGAASVGAKQTPKRGTTTYGDFQGTGVEVGHADNGGSAARFFYTAKADASDRIGSKHPTVKPVDLMQWLVRLITPPGGTVLDPFAGTGTTGEAAWREGFKVILIEREEEYQTDIAERMRLCLAGPDEKRREIVKRKGHEADAGPLFAALAEGVQQ